ncbi:CvpA family protein [Conchiformibius steedae]|uniref:CvpA family protein n=1 Tax=Conchiformibius steedae TaxID=153493 RepID=A0A3P2A7T9_9NEIS|nr:CvpA family protein [Conchiformibius steedae]RRD91499.1 CvpA family protein [Conchiformibius steedae]
MFTLFDLLAVGTITVCLLIGTSRGLIDELFNFFGWIVSLILARMLASPVADAVLPTMQPRQMAVVCSFVIVFVGARLLQHFVRFALHSAISKAKLTNVNRMLGGLLGILKGILFVCLAVFVCSFSNLPYSDDWRDAHTSEFFENLVKGATPMLPEVFADQVHFPARDVNGSSEPPPRKPRRRPPEVEKLQP